LQVLLIRHPKPEIVSGICYGSSDIPAQAEALSTAFAWLDSYLPEDAEIIASPLLRCAQLAAQLRLSGQRTLKLDARLAERCCGAWELKSWDRIPRAEIDAWVTNFMDYAAPGAESVRQLQIRVLAAWESYQVETKSQTRVLLTHAGPIQVLLAHLTCANLGAKPIIEVPCGAAVLLTQANTEGTNTVACWQYRVVTP
jgi:alpha-ribazole phosphatase